MRHRKLWIVGAVVFVLIVILGKCATAAECLPSASAVRAAHGITTWSTWHHVGGKKCYSLGERKEVVHLVSSHRGRPNRTVDVRPRPARSLAGAVPMPRSAPPVYAFTTPVDLIVGILTPTPQEQLLGYVMRRSGSLNIEEYRPR